MRSFLCTVLVVLCANVALAGDPPNQYTIPCTLPRAEAVQKILDVLTKAGYRITLVDAQMGLVSGEWIEIGTPFDFHYILQAAATGTEIRIVTMRLFNDGDGGPHFENVKRDSFGPTLDGIAAACSGTDASSHK